MVYGLLADGTVARFTGSSWSPQEASAGWNASELSVTEGDQLLIIANGRLRAVSHDEPRTLSCDARPALVAVAAVAANEAFVLDQAGALYFNSNGSCDPVPAPVR
ncbi:MAG TPA: hypothetical protein VHW01_04100, partial [Polyangiaceae bacterium]|nr:hypothetical protein [Polyangiaceae bacterium]